jgi:hypothetical protein
VVADLSPSGNGEEADLVAASCVDEEEDLAGASCIIEVRNWSGHHALSRCGPDRCVVRR